MPRKSRKSQNAKIFHVVIQGLNKEYIFEKETYIYKYKEYIIEKLKKIDITILAYCIMNNHAHLLIYSDEINKLSKYMQCLNTSYSKFYNKDKERVGYVFKDRFFTQQIYDRKQLFNCLVYIHNNPVRAKLCNKMDEYKYSSYNEFIGKKEIITEKSIKLLFENQKNYITLFNMIHKNFEEDFQIFDIKEITIQKLIERFEKTYKIKINNLKKDKEILKKFIIDARNLTDITLEKLAEILKISKSTVAIYEKQNGKENRPLFQK